MGLVHTNNWLDESKRVGSEKAPVASATCITTVSRETNACACPSACSLSRILSNGRSVEATSTQKVCRRPLSRKQEISERISLISGRGFRVGARLGAGWAAISGRERRAIPLSRRAAARHHGYTRTCQRES